MTALEFLSELAWRSAVVAAVPLVISISWRNAAADNRSQILNVGLFTLIALPVIHVWGPSWNILLNAELPLAKAAISAASGAVVDAPRQWLAPAPSFILLVYGAGVLGVSANLIAGLVKLQRWTEEGRVIEHQTWLCALQQICPDSPKRARLQLLVSNRIVSPLSWGMFLPVLLIDPETLSRPEDADAILAHEFAHIERRDWPMLMLARTATIIFWFNPLVWALAREARRKAEEAADARALQCIEPERYAQVLINCLKPYKTAVPAQSISISPPHVAERIKAILSQPLNLNAPRSGLTFIAIGACILIASVIAAISFAPLQSTSSIAAYRGADNAPEAVSVEELSALGKQRALLGLQREALGADRLDAAAGRLDRHAARLEEEAQTANEPNAFVAREALLKRANEERQQAENMRQQAATVRARMEMNPAFRAVKEHL